MSDMEERKIFLWSVACTDREKGNWIEALSIEFET